MPTVAERASEALATRPAQDASLGPWLSGDRDAAQGASAPSSERSKPLRALALLSDDRLAAHSARGDSGAFAELYRRHHQRLYRYCLTLLHDPDDAADVLQTTMAKALGALERGERVKGVRSWLFRIAHNTAIDLVRARRPQAPLDALEEIESSALTAPSAASQAQSRAEMAETVADIRGLPRRQQSALVMRELAALPYDEIAGALETSPLAARQLVHQARSALHDTRSGRDMDCETARQALGERDGRRPRDRRVRAHVAFCDACASFGQSIQERRAALTAFAPPLAPAAATEILGRLLGAGSTSSAGLAGGGGLAAGVGKLAAAPGIGKLAAAMAVGATAVAAAGGAAVVGAGGDRGEASADPAVTDSLLKPQPPGLRAMSPPVGPVKSGTSTDSDRSGSRRADSKRSSRGEGERKGASAGTRGRERGGEARASSGASDVGSDGGSGDSSGALSGIAPEGVRLPGRGALGSGVAGVEVRVPSVESPGDASGGPSLDLPDRLPDQDDLPAGLSDGASIRSGDDSTGSEGVSAQFYEGTDGAGDGWAESGDDSAGYDNDSAGSGGSSGQAGETAEADD
jgi:RNA polymerase sigma factor (sigma-70 family)